MLAASLLTATQCILAMLLYGGVLLWALCRVSWIELLADTRRQHLLFGSVFVIALLWMVRRDFDNGLTFHFIGLTAVTLLLNWQLALIAGTLAQLGLLVIGWDDVAAFGVNGVLRVLLPVAVTLLISQSLERFKPRNLFMYIFISGFFAAGVSAVVTILAGMGLLAWSGELVMPAALLEVFGYLLLVAFPEAFINGTVIAGLVVFYPDWLETFDTDRYLQEPFDPDNKG
ncbi:energy-coupling factor ABC transporter permease [Halopseudomonas pelagia]|uniref:energy-coupling factor ABC transporter permease n=1 Tax=Halopseudomonas pelagia TaxID=553151 RepID=UPI0030D8B664|tara:strand:- start:26633 stop:27319 length:687 start_codon:yes stop_codon:yes gene_type:complete